MGPVDVEFEGKANEEQLTIVSPSVLIIYIPADVVSPTGLVSPTGVVYLTASSPTASAVHLSNVNISHIASNLTLDSWLPFQIWYGFVALCIGLAAVAFVLRLFQISVSRRSPPVQSGASPPPPPYAPSSLDSKSSIPPVELQCFTYLQPAQPATSVLSIDPVSSRPDAPPLPVASVSSPLSSGLPAVIQPALPAPLAVATPDNLPGFAHLPDELKAMIAEEHALEPRILEIHISPDPHQTEGDGCRIRRWAFKCLAPFPPPLHVNKLFRYQLFGKKFYKTAFGRNSPKREICYNPFVTTFLLPDRVLFTIAGREWWPGVFMNPCPWINDERELRSHFPEIAGIRHLGLVETYFPFGCHKHLSDEALLKKLLFFFENLESVLVIQLSTVEIPAKPPEDASLEVKKKWIDEAVILKTLTDGASALRRPSTKLSSLFAPLLTAPGSEFVQEVRWEHLHEVERYGRRHKSKKDFVERVKNIYAKGDGRTCPQVRVMSYKSYVVRGT